MALKALSQNGITGALVRTMDFAQRYTAAVDPNEADTAGIRLMLPKPEILSDAPQV